MPRVTGLGCTATALCGAFAAVVEDPVLAVSSAMAVMGIAGEMAADKAAGPGTLQLQITSLDYSSYVGRIAIGRVLRGDIREGDDCTLCKKAGVKKRVRIKELYTFRGLGREKVEHVRSGDICAVVGLDDFEIGDTIADLEHPEQLPRISIDEPTMSMLFAINNSPFFGKEGKYVTSRHIRDRLLRETEKNLALRVMMTDREDSFLVHGRGVLHLSILIETMRREGYEFQVGKPQVILKDIEGVTCEPYETLVIDVPEEYSGKVVDYVTQRKGTLELMEPRGDLLHLEFGIPARGLIGLRSNLLTSTSGESVINHRFRGYLPFAGDLKERQNGSLISIEGGMATAYAIDRLQDRGWFFVEPGERVYKGMVVGENTRGNDLEVNIVKGKKLTNMRASGSDENIKLAPKLRFTLEEAMEYIKEDEYLEITPVSLRMRKI
jgi:GTP-binding protein